MNAAGNSLLNVLLIWSPNSLTDALHTEGVHVAGGAGDKDWRQQSHYTQWQAGRVLRWLDRWTQVSRGYGGVRSECQVLAGATQGEDALQARL